MHEHFDHTADLGLRAEAATLNGLFAEMAACLTAAMLDNPDAIRPDTPQEIAVTGGDREYLLYDWLRELLTRSERDGMLYARFEVAVTADGLTATVWGEPLDRTRHQLSREVKAVTYHDLIVTETPGGFRAEAIVDI
jgi:SHS2 domain-containing protein